ncbi:hypothetical protein F4811DRAFT_572493 [Daldinia bambusicola]|nr:hypothetical protein F4811DRAFT_572493 [Daldinia bambusicola]
MELFNPVDYSKNWNGGGFLIGIDIGTTYSGASYAYHKDGILKCQVTILTLRLWPGPPGVNLGDIKIPSTISYDVNGAVTWGLGNQGKQHVISWFKLLLVDDDDLRSEFHESKQLQEAKRLMSISRKSPVQVVADLPRNIFEHIVVYMGQEKTNKFVKETPFHLVITVPAIWKGRALEGVHRAEDRFYDALRSSYMARDQMEWVVRRGDNIETQGQKVREYEMLFNSRARGFHGSQEVIYESKSAHPSDRKVELWNEDGFQAVATIKVQTPCPVERLLKVKRGGA